MRCISDEIAVEDRRVHLGREPGYPASADPDLISRRASSTNRVCAASAT